MEVIKAICEVCGKIFDSTDGSNICPDCKKESNKVEDDSMFDPILVDGNEDDDWEEDPDYEMDDNGIDEEDPFELDLDEDLFDDDY